MLNLCASVRACVRVCVCARVRVCVRVHLLCMRYASQKPKLRPDALSLNPTPNFNCESLIVTLTLLLTHHTNPWPDDSILSAAFGGFGGFGWERRRLIASCGVHVCMYKDI